MELEFQATGTTWWLCSEGASHSLLVRTRDQVKEYEERLSRFLPDSALSRLNRDRVIEDEVLADVLRVAERLRLATAGAFDVSTGAAVVAAGYGRSFEEIRNGPALIADVRRPRLTVAGPRIRLVGDGLIDLGGVAKGWIVDRAAALLASAGPCLVDGGGDLRVVGAPRAGEWRVGAGDRFALGLANAAVATSSTRKRRWTMGNAPAHHIVQPESGIPATGDLVTAVVVAAEAAVADALATALVADPERGLRGAALSGAAALVQRQDGTWEMTPGLGRHLR